MDITKEQVKRQLEVLTKIKELFAGQEKEVILRGIELVKKILQFEGETVCVDCAEKLYDLLDNDDYGLVILQEQEESEKRLAAFNCAIDSIAISSRYAYELAGQIYFPEPIEMVSEDTFIHLNIELEKLNI
ncbi:Imm6 family immunity protein [Butyrivibrio sp. INlla14]|uniref:Imm6 family immunity protein n=1 Tax=Butyrivibrio sp. INlla14 TaxID=1520808 RepID=UPI0008767E29|nr:Imm6 family immunity protein [Butyrivibrio sp. INlla14]SCY47499.1 Immunity protein Imm6 [Butyrivibrio sp. INlla14]